MCLLESLFSPFIPVSPSSWSISHVRPQICCAQNATSPRRTFIRRPDQLKPEEKNELEMICQHGPTAQKAYELTQQFIGQRRRKFQRQVGHRLARARQKRPASRSVF